MNTDTKISKNKVLKLSKFAQTKVYWSKNSVNTKQAKLKIPYQKH
jgi:hypothetical protein